MSVYSSARPGLLAALLFVAAASAGAESFASSASSAGSASVGSASDSIRGSSNSSSGENHAAAGDYRVLAVTWPEDRPGFQRIALAPLSAERGAQPFELQLPVAATQQRPIAPGDTIRVDTRPYGLVFAYADAAQPFFLVMADERRRELDAHALTL